MNLPHLLPTTVVGSFPCVEIKGYHLDHYKKSIQFAVHEQIRAGVDIITDGQIRDDMVSLFLSKLPGISDNNVIGKIQAADKHVNLKEICYARLKNKYVKGNLTGPCTLAYALQITTPMYRNKEEVIMDLARALHIEAMHQDAVGVSIIQVDEPILSTGAVPVETADKALKIIFEGIKADSCIHTCGILHDIADKWVKLPVDILDFEYAVSPENLETLGKQDLNGKKIGCGCVQSSVQTVESVDEIRKRILACVDVFGKENVLVDPDCGLRMHTPEGAFAKLENMCKAAKMVREENL